MPTAMEISIATRDPKTVQMATSRPFALRYRRASLQAALRYVRANGVIANRTSVILNEVKDLAADIVARTLSESLGRTLGQPVLVQNRAGAGSSIAAEHVAKSTPDGYTLLIASPSSISVNIALNPKLNFRASDLTPITKVSSSPLVIVVNPETGIRSIAELIATAQKPEVKTPLAREGTEVVLSRSPETFAAFLIEDAKFWVKLAKQSGATAD